MLSALAAQHQQRRSALRTGADHVSWKVGLGERERIDGERVFGCLASATRRDPDGSLPVFISYDS